jgi:hypothetical protein
LARALEFGSQWVKDDEAYGVLPSAVPSLAPRT